MLLLLVVLVVLVVFVLVVLVLVVGMVHLLVSFFRFVFFSSAAGCFFSVALVTT